MRAESVRLACRAASTAVRMADISLTEALGVEFYCYRGTKLPAATGKKRWKWALASICSHEKIWVFKIFGMVQFSWI